MMKKNERQISEKTEELFRKLDKEYADKIKDDPPLSAKDMAPDEVIRTLSYNEYCFHVALVASYTDWKGYTTYVFKNLGNTSGNPLMDYFMCVRFPNWDCPFLANGEEGYVELRFVVAGNDKWYKDGFFYPYQYTGIHFVNFVPFGSESAGAAPGSSEIDLSDFEDVDDDTALLFSKKDKDD